MFSQFRKSAFRVQRRCLGTGTKGKDITNVPAQLQAAREFFTKPTYTYTEFKYQCEAIRLFAFGGLVTVLTADLIMRPPKSTYCKSWGITHLPGNLLGLVWQTKGDCFLTEAPTYKGPEPYDAYKAMKRRK